MEFQRSPFILHCKGCHSCPSPRRARNANRCFAWRRNLAGKQVCCENCLQAFTVPPAVVVTMPLDIDAPVGEVAKPADPPMDVPSREPVAVPLPSDAGAAKAPKPHPRRNPPHRSQHLPASAGAGFAGVFFLTLLGAGAFALYWVYAQLAPPVVTAAPPAPVPPQPAKIDIAIHPEFMKAPINEFNDRINRREEPSRPLGVRPDRYGERARPADSDQSVKMPKAHSGLYRSEAGERQALPFYRQGRRFHPTHPSSR